MNYRRIIGGPQRFEGNRHIGGRFALGMKKRYFHAGAQRISLEVERDYRYQGRITDTSQLREGDLYLICEQMRQKETGFYTIETIGPVEMVSRGLRIEGMPGECIAFNYLGRDRRIRNPLHYSLFDLGLKNSRKTGKITRRRWLYCPEIASATKIL